MQAANVLTRSLIKRKASGKETACLGLVSKDEHDCWHAVLGGATEWALLVRGPGPGFPGEQLAGCLTFHPALRISGMGIEELFKKSSEQMS